ncbi:hypothetical protein M408DRAFT_24343 [Serendipita vermifera MAFF 305830]|uniref:Nephrocystin 3-like N-terminal domain-containing protein n=1 Tax=Serendipita vermifera MAFF 305830 TaxID=933852 RepID=A0A0C3AT14_SERVB|nr:hypothetical protein M408DRAFT_24343 [Serendipita vermifera MAFF 305830]
MNAVSGATLRAVSNIEKDLLQERLDPIGNANYQKDRGCMEGTRTQVISDIVLWATTSSNQDLHPENPKADSVAWVYGMPGIGKTAIAHSICHRLQGKNQLGGSFFCRRDDPARSETKSVLPTLIYELATTFGPYRNQVVQALHDDPELKPQLTSGELFLSSLQLLEVHPLRTLVLVIDALDECGEPGARQQLLGHLLTACRQNRWLKAIVISRPERDIRSFFNAHGVVGRDLSQEDNSRTDIRQFTEARMKMVADERHVSQHPEPWVGERRLGHIVNRSGGLFIFVETLSQYLMKYKNPKLPLDRLLAGPSEEASVELHKLYLAAIESRVGSEEAESRLIARAVIGAAPHRALCDEAIAAFTGLQLATVSSWVDDLSSLLYREHTTNGGIRVLHISILEYFTGPFCPLDFRVDLKQANIELGLYCLRTMIKELRFNMCKLKTSYQTNSEIEDLNERVQENISDILQYSCLYWSNHLCSSLDPVSKEVCESLGIFLSGEWVLYWLEALSVMGRVPTAIEALRNIKRCRKIFEEGIVYLADEALRFILFFLTPISTSAPHIYISALPFIPSESSLWKATCKSFPDHMRVCEGRMKKWPGMAARWTGHTFYILDIAYSPDGLNVVSGSFDETIRIWDAATGTPVGEPLKGHTEDVTSVAYSPDGRNIVSGSGDNTIRIWAAATGLPVGEPLKGHAQRVSSVAYSPNGRNIVSGSYDLSIRIWDVETGTLVGEPLEGHTGGVMSVVYSPDGLKVASGSSDQTIRIWDAVTGVPVGEPLKGRAGTINSIAYSPDGRNIVCGSKGNTIQIWDATMGLPVGEPWEGHTQAVMKVAYSPDGQSIVSGSEDNTIRIWDAATGALIGDPLNGHTDKITSIAYSPDGRSIVSCSYDQTIRAWDAATGKPIAEPPAGHTNGVTSVAYSPDGQNIVTGSWDRTIRIWNADTGVLVNGPMKGHIGWVVSVAYSPDGRNIVSGSEDKTIRIWDAATGLPVGKPLKGHADKVRSVAYSPDGQKIVSDSEDNTIRIWDAATGALIGDPLHGPTDDITSIAYSPDGQNIVSGSLDQTIRIWDASTGAPVGEPLKGHTDIIISIAYSPDGRNIVSGSGDETIRIWDAVTGAPVGEPLKGHTSFIKSVAYSPDNRRIISSSYDSTIRIWDVATGAPIGDPLRGHIGLITSVAYSPDGRYIVSGSMDHTVRIWDAQHTPNSESFRWKF